MASFTNLSPDPKAAQDPRPRSLANAATSTDDTELTPTETPAPAAVDPYAAYPTVEQYAKQVRARSAGVPMPGESQFGTQYRNFAGWLADSLGNVVGRGIAPILDTAALPAAGAPTGSNAQVGTAQAMGQQAGRAVIPQNTTQLGQAAGMGAAAALTGGAGPIIAGGTMAAGTLLGGAAGGGVGASDFGTGVLEGAKNSILPALASGGATGAWTAARRTGVQNVERRLSQEMAGNLSVGVKQIAKLQGVFNSMPSTPEGIRSFVLDPIPGGEESAAQILLSKRAELADQTIKQAIKPGTMFPDPLRTEGTVDPAVATLRRQLGLRADEPLPPAFAKQLPGVDTSGYVNWDTARANLSDLGRRVGSATGNERGELSKQYAEAMRGLRAKLTEADPTGKAVKEFNDAQGVYEAGIKLTDSIKSWYTGGGKQAQSVILHPNRVLHDLSDDAVGKDGLSARLGYDGYQALLQSVRPGYQPGTADVMSPSGVGLSEYAHVPGGTLIRGRLTTPQIAGHNPLNLATPQQLGVGAGAQLGLRGVSGLVTPELQGLPGLTGQK